MSNVDVNKLTSKRIKHIFISLLCLLSIAFTITPPIVNAFADDTKDQGESLIKKLYDNFSKGMSTTSGVAGKFSDVGLSSNEKTFPYVWSRLMAPGYANNVSNYVAASGADTSMITTKGNSKYLCNRNHPHNLVDYNCDIPNISAQILQAITRVFTSTGITGGERQSAQPAMGLGIPAGIPGKTVPVQPNDRKTKYTALEVLGYNMNWTQYNGEWDDIIPSTNARLLSNYGSLDKIKLTGTSLWNGLSSGFTKYIHSAKLTNPISWFTSISRAWSTSGKVTAATVLDSSDANIATTHQWTRSGNSVASSFYRVYTLSDRQVISAGTARTMRKIIPLLNKLFGSNKKTQELVSYKAAPSGFKYDKNKTTAAFDKKKAKIEAYNKKQKKESKKKDVPKPGAGDYVTEKDQLSDWMKSNKTVNAAKKYGITVNSPATYSDFKAQWASSYASALNKFMNDSSSNSVTKMLEKKAINLISKSDPYANPNTAISHYVCSHKDGTPYVTDAGNYVYLYTAQNNGNTEHINQACSANLPIRPTVQSGFFGNGYPEDKITDTRSVVNNDYSIMKLIPFLGNFGEGLQRFNAFFIKFNTQVINEMLNLSFSPLMKQLGITKIVKVGFKDFKNSIFMPLLTIIISIAGFEMLLDAIKSRSLKHFFGTFLVLVLVLISAFVIFKHSTKVIDGSEEIPLTFENAIEKATLKSSAGDNMCSTKGQSKSGTRTAQCYVWKNLIFNTWTYGQFGTGYRNLWPNQSSHPNKMKNKDTELVGNPYVNLGANSGMSNWALYQMYLMTSGTITTPDSSRPVGVQDNNLYRLVDLQAGPDNAYHRDTRYFSAWRGSSGNRTMVSILGLILSIIALIAFGGLLLTKIELTFLMSIMILGLPVMLLAGLTPRGQTKLKGYLLTMFGLFMKRLLLVVMFCSLLRIWDSSFSGSNGSFILVFTGAASILIFFIIYKPEILHLFDLDDQNLLGGRGLFSGDPDEVRNAINNHMPLYVKNKIYSAGSRIKGASSGLFGGALGGFSNANAQLKNDKFISNNKISQADKMNARLRGMFTGAVAGSREASNFQSRRTENFLTRNGLSKIEQFGRVDKALNENASNKIANNQSQLGELYRQSSTQSKYGTRLSNSAKLSPSEISRLRNNTRLMSLLAKQQKLAEEAIKKAEQSSALAAKNPEESSTLTTLSKQIDKSLKQQARTDKYTHPISYFTKNGEITTLSDRAKAKEIQVDTNVSDRINSIKQSANTSSNNSDTFEQSTNNSDNSTNSTNTSDSAQAEKTINKAKRTANNSVANDEDSTAKSENSSNNHEDVSETTHDENTNSVKHEDKPNKLKEVLSAKNNLNKSSDTDMKDNTIVSNSTSLPKTLDKPLSGKESISKHKYIYSKSSVTKLKSFTNFNPNRLKRTMKLNNHKTLKDINLSNKAKLKKTSTRFKINKRFK